MTTNYLFVIGISNYDMPRFPALKNAVNDAKAIINILEKKYGFEEYRYLFNEQANRAGIIDAFVELNNISNEDNLIIFFAGHGDQDSNTRQGFMIPIDGNQRSQFISYTEIKDFVEHIKAKHILLIFDCCFSANFISRTRTGIQSGASIQKVYSLPSRYFLGAGGEERVSDGGNEENSPFTSAILHFLRENNNKELLCSALAINVRQQVGNLKRQQPVFEPIDVTGHTVGGEFVFVIKSDNTPEIAEIPTNEYRAEKIEDTTTKSNNNPKTRAKLYTSSEDSHLFFSRRITDAFPGFRGLFWVSSPKVAAERLKIILRNPLNFLVDEDDDFEGKTCPIWWLRAGGSMNIDSFKILKKPNCFGFGKTEVLVCEWEYIIDKMAVYYNPAKTYHNFIYIETKKKR